MRNAIVARESELEAVERFLRMVAGSPAALVFEGPAGIGKTTLWDETLRTARERGYQVLTARPTEAEARLSYAAVTDLVGEVFDRMRTELPRPQDRALAAALLRADDEAAEARTVATAFAAVLARLAEDGPVVVAIDDVQWLDSASRRVLEFATRRLTGPIGLALTLRSDEHGDAPLGLARAALDGGLERIQLEPLSLAALHHLVRDRVGLSPTRPVLARLVAASGGNPYFALEIARILVDESEERTLDEPLPVPSTLHELVAWRLEFLSSAGREAALVAAALAEPTSSIVAAALGENHEALAEAERAGVLVVERGRIRFAQPLLASVVYGDAPDADVRRLHARLAELVADPEEGARHIALSTVEPDAKAAEAIENGARRAARRGAQDAAAELFDAAWRVTPRDRRDELARRLLGGAAALNAIGDFGEARSRAERALAEACDGALRAEVLSFLAALAWFAGAARDATAHVERALEEVPDDSPAKGAMYAKLVRFNFAQDVRRAVEYADAALTRLDAAREPALVAHVLIDRFVSGAMVGLGADRSLLERGLALEADAAPDLPEGPQPMPLIWFHCTDDVDGAYARHAFEEEWYRERGEDVWRADRLSHLALVDLRAGRWSDAERRVEESSAALEKVDLAGPRAMVLEKRSLVDGHRGRTDRARATLTPLIEQFERAGQRWWAALTLSTLGLVEFAAGDHAAADGALERMHDHARAVGVEDVLFDRSEPFHVESLLALGEPDRAHEALARLERRDRTLPRLWTAAALPRTRALVLAAEGDGAAALAVLDEVDLSRLEPLPFELGCTLLVKGRILRRAKQKKASAETLDAAHRVFEELGAPAWTAQARAELERVGLRHRAPDELTATERRVAELVAGGLTNREAAEAAFMSPKTVEANLARVYRKLGIRSRAELGARIASDRGDGGAQT